MSSRGSPGKLPFASVASGSTWETLRRDELTSRAMEVDPETAGGVRLTPREAAEEAGQGGPLLLHDGPSGPAQRADDPIDLTSPMGEPELEGVGLGRDLGGCGARASGERASACMVRLRRSIGRVCAAELRPGKSFGGANP